MQIHTNSLGSHLSNILIFITLVKYSTWAIMCSVSATETHELTLHYPTGWRHRDVALAWRAGELHSHRKTVSRDESAFAFKKDISMHTWAYKACECVKCVCHLFFHYYYDLQSLPWRCPQSTSWLRMPGDWSGDTWRFNKNKHIAISVLEMWRMDWMRKEMDWNGIGPYTPEALNKIDWWPLLKSSKHW